MRERYSTFSIENFEKKLGEKLFKAAFGICLRIEREGKKEFKERVKEYITNFCPLKKCAVWKMNLEKCPNHLCWVAEGPTWHEFLLPDIQTIYFLLMDTYIAALYISEDAEEVALKENPLDLINEELKAQRIINLIIKVFKEASILKHRIPIIKDILETHQKGNYSLTVPVLIIQIEGILHDLAYHFKWEFKKQEMYKNESAKVWAIIQKLNDKPFEDTLSSFYHRKKGRESPRNLILHGRFIEYGKEHKLSTALILVLIYLIAFSLMKIEERVSIKY